MVLPAESRRNGDPGETGFSAVDRKGLLARRALRSTAPLPVVPGPRFSLMCNMSSIFDRCMPNCDRLLCNSCSAGSALIASSPEAFPAATADVEAARILLVAAPVARASLTVAEASCPGPA